MAYDDKLGSALTVHTVPTRLAPSQAWPSARTTITNTGHTRQEGVGRRTQGLRGSEPAPLPGGKAVGMSLFGRRWPSGDVRSPLTSTQSPDPLLPRLPPFANMVPRAAPVRCHSALLLQPLLSSSKAGVAPQMLRGHPGCLLPARSLQNRAARKPHVI